MLPGERYDAQGNNSDVWRSHGVSLSQVADLLRGQLQQGWSAAAPLGYYPLLCALLIEAFGLECLFKSLWLAQGNKLAKGGRYLPIPKVDNHDLEALSRKTCFKVSSSEAKTLALLTMFGIWARYPVANDWKQQQPGHTWSRDDWENAAAVVSRLHRAIDKASKSHDSKGIKETGR